MGCARKRPKLMRITVLPAGLFFFLVVFVGGCAPSANLPPRRPDAVPIQVATAVRKTVPVNLRAIGNVEAYSTVSIRARVDGELTGVYFKEGDDVTKGQLLFTLDPRPFRAALDQAKSNLAKDAAQLENAEAEAARSAALLQRGIVSKEQNDLAQTTAEATRSAEQADQAAVENATLQLSYCEIRSPIDGRTGSLLVHTGNLVQASLSSTLVVINQISPIYVDFSVPEQDLSEIREQMAAGKLSVLATAPDDPRAKSAGGTVSFIDNAVDSTTGTVKIKGTFPSRERRLWPGQFVDVELTLTEQRDALLVPSQAVQTGQSGQFVFVVKPDMTVETRPVVSRRTYEGDAVIDQGLESGDTVVTDGQLRLVAGAKVQIKKERSPTRPS